jgi:hypothetical protein
VQFAAINKMLIKPNQDITVLCNVINDEYDRNLPAYWTFVFIYFFVLTSSVILEGNCILIIWKRNIFILQVLYQTKLFEYKKRFAIIIIAFYIVTIMICSTTCILCYCVLSYILSLNHLLLIKRKHCIHTNRQTTCLSLTYTIIY